MHTRVHVCECTYTCVHMCVCECMYTHMHVCECTHMCVHICGGVSAWTRVCVYVGVRVSGWAHMLHSCHPGRGQRCLAWTMASASPCPLRFSLHTAAACKTSQAKPRSVHTFHLSQSKRHSWEGVPKPCTMWPLVSPIPATPASLLFPERAASLASGPLHSLFSWPGKFFLHMPTWFTPPLCSGLCSCPHRGLPGPPHLNGHPFPHYHSAYHHLPSLCFTSLSPLCNVSSTSRDTESPAPGAVRAPGWRLVIPGFCFREGLEGVRHREDKSGHQSRTGQGGGDHAGALSSAPSMGSAQVSRDSGHGSN